ncbi:aldehyde dehydrogenase [Paenibacillus sp. JCM 10914]|uniref:aldehyde dehydrogenase n=1 Tax=Paenibacillus sp. JCM 10914 TaxID=1236974 RepID=UPI0003CC3EE7|nr:aldehyde dehydrogenase [Paenibacillus sp. JCM 10914]GAE08188.1 aldehyde dehydrogenase [Paenibacillus sp. JCM 10914]
MNVNDSIAAIVSEQERFFHKGITREVGFRLQQLRKLRQVIIARESDIIRALRKDLNKGEQEAYTTEIGIVYKELSFIIKNLKGWAKPRRVKTALTHVGSRGMIYPEPYGKALIIAPWNYPWQLAISPLIGALAAGNTAIVKPSELTPAVSGLITSIIQETFPPEYVASVEGGPDVSTSLLEQPMDYIFFTGSTHVGRIVMEAAAKRLTPVTLELGGKSPCIVHEDAPLELAAQRVAFGKFTNAGQTCVAPDYLLVHSRVKEKFISHLKGSITSFYGQDPLTNIDYGRIVSKKHYDRLSSFLDNGNQRHGGRTDKDQLRIEPTILDDITWDMPVMEEEIFGPLCPILTYDDLNDAIRAINDRPKPLALYLFTDNEDVQDHVLSSISFGGGCVNDTLMHLATPYLPFGGVGESGMGAYHGEYSFHTFSHSKSVLKQTNRFDFKFRYPSKNGLAILKKLLKP